MGILLCWGVTHAALSKYQQKEQAARDACKAERAKMTPQQQKQLQCGTPEVSLVSRAVVKPGETAEVSINGKFPAGTSFVFHSDSIEVLKEASNANSYRATIKAVPGGLPRTVSVSALTPVCCKGAYLSQAIKITANYLWDLQAANGWKIKAQPLPSDAPETGNCAMRWSFSAAANRRRSPGDRRLYIRPKEIPTACLFQSAARMNPA
jgi:hypothetical protein